MIGMFVFFIVIIGICYEQFKDFKEDVRCVQDNQFDNGRSYVGYDGKTRFVETGEVVSYHYNGHGDRVIRGKKGYLYKNFSEEDRIKFLKKSKEEAIEYNRTVYRLFDNTKTKQTFMKEPCGVRYKDLKTGAIYVVRNIRDAYYFVDIDTELVVRKTDYQIADEAIFGDKYRYLIAQKTIKELNTDPFENGQRKWHDIDSGSEDKRDCGAYDTAISMGRIRI